jgi:hypothetical protein
MILVRKHECKILLERTQEYMNDDIELCLKYVG